MVYTLGLHNSYVAGGALFKDNILIGAVSEERFTREKNSRGIPKNSINYLLNEAGITLQEVDEFCYSMINNVYPKESEIFDILRDAKDLSIHWLNNPEKGFERIQSEINWNKKYINEYFDWLKSNSISREKSFEYDHHLSHASGAIFSSPFDQNEEAIVFTADGKGGFRSSSVNFWDGNTLVTRSYSSSFHSFGYFYGTITRLLGFEPERHEGKITGLAAHGNPCELINIFREFIQCIDGRIIFKPSDYYLPWFVGIKELPKYKYILTKYSREDIAAAAQQILEEVICEWIEFNINDVSSKEINVCIAGGVFSNVKLNQKIKSLSLVKNLFVMPAMGDAGLPLGGCLLHKYKKNRKFWIYQASMGIGPKYEWLEFENHIDDKLEVNTYRDIKNEAAKLLNQGKIIGYFEGGMEFGPRALCHRSIIANARDKNINNILNKRLLRSDFMPFSPVTTDTLANLCFKDISKIDATLPFMTSTVEVTDLFAKKCPAAVHVDMTARPQIVTKESNKFMFELINLLNQLYGDICLINTSFNLHEEPIICTPKDAIRALKLNAVDLLITCDHIIKNQR